nr:RHS repeat-associated core domain-containing protein [Chitinophagaceae bacterium]
MSLVLKMFDFVSGVDIHMTFIPTPAGPVPTPLPYPFMAMIFNPMDLITSTTKVNNMAIATSGSDGMLTVPPKAHIPFGTGFVMAPTIGHDQKLFFGALNTFSDGSFIGAGPFMVMSCNDFGLPLSVSPSKGSWKPQFNRYLPLACSIPIPKGMIVNTNAAIVPDLMTALKGLAMSFAFSYGLKGLGALASKLGKALRKAQRGIKAGGKFPRLSSFLCRTFGDPVDLVRGYVVCYHEDFDFQGIIPFQIKRNYYSNSDWNGHFGYGWHSIFDEHFSFNPQTNTHTWINEEGLHVDIKNLVVGEEMFMATSKILIFHSYEKGIGYYDYKSRLTYLFKSFGHDVNYLQLHLIRDDYNNQIEFVYNANGVIQKVIDTCQREINFKLSIDKKIQEINIEKLDGTLQNIASYEYDEHDNLIFIADALKKRSKIEYRNHLMVSKTDRNGDTFFWEFENYELGAKCIHTYGVNNLLKGKLKYEADRTILEDSNGKIWQYIHKNGLVIEEVNPLGHSKKTMYNEHSLAITTIDELGRQTLMGYDVIGNLVSTQLPNGATTKITYNEELLPTMAILANGGVYSWQYNERNKLTSEFNPAKQLVRREYNSNGLLEKIISPNGQEINFTYDDHFNVTKLTRANKTETKWHYNEFGKCTQIEYASGAFENYQYDELQRLISMKTADGNFLKMEYDAYDNIEMITDKHYNVEMEYTPLGSLKKRRQAGTEIEFFYDHDNKLTALRNEKNEHYQFYYNSAGKVVRELGFDGLERQYKRNEAHEVVTTVRPGGKLTRYEYDGLGKVLQITYDDNSEELFSYDPLGNIIEAVNEHCVVTFERDEAGRIIKETQNGIVIESEFNNLGIRTQLKTNLDAFIQFDIDAQGNIEGYTAKASHTEWLAKIKNDVVGFEIERHLPGEAILHFERDQTGKPLQQFVEKGTSKLLHQSYTWQSGNRLQKITHELSGDSTHFNYDKLGNLTGSRNKHEYIYRAADEVGNYYETENKTDRKYEAGGKLVWKQGTTYEYDLEGNLIKKKEPFDKIWQYSYFANGMLKEVIRPDKKKVSFTYDALGRRLSKKFESTITKWVWDGNLPLHEWQETNEAQKIDEQGNIVPKEKLKFTTWLFEEGSFVPCAKLQDGKSFSIITDHLGTPMAMLNQQGEKVWEGIQDIYGRITTLVGNKEDCPFRYQGQYADIETGLYYNRFRYYAPEEGMYISQDPIRLNGGIMLYTYVRDTNIFIDIFGLVFNGVNFSGQNVFYPAGKGQYSEVVIKMQGSRGRDFTEAYRLAGIDKSGANGFTWHHVDDFDPKTGTCTMQLVTTEAHVASFPHGGSVSQFE